MKTILLIAVVVVCSAYARHHGHHGQISDAILETIRNCELEVGISLEDARALRTLPANATMNEPQMKVVCCVSKNKITDGKLDITSLQNMINEHNRDGTTVDVSAAVDECQKITNSNATDLNDCEKTAPLMHCLCYKLHESQAESESGTPDSE